MAAPAHPEPAIGAWKVCGVTVHAQAVLVGTVTHQRHLQGAVPLPYGIHMGTRATTKGRRGLHTRRGACLAAAAAHNSSTCLGGTATQHTGGVKRVLPGNPDNSRPA